MNTKQRRLTHGSTFDTNAYRDKPVAYHTRPRNSYHTHLPMSDLPVNSTPPANTDIAPVALLYCTDLMFGVQLQKMARATGFRDVTIRPNMPLPPASIMVVDLSARGDWQSAIREAVKHNIPVVAFGPHMDAQARRRAKEAGATRVLANSNLARDLPGILLQYRQAHNLPDAGVQDQARG